MRERNITLENAVYLEAEQRVREERWNAKGIARVIHPKYGSVIVPHSSNFAAVRNAAEFWGCDWLEVMGANVWQTYPEDKSVSLGPEQLSAFNHYYKEAAMSFCRGCSREILWIHMRSGKAMPVDPEPVFVKEGQQPGKRTFITDEGETIVGTETPVDTGTIGFVPHWATCPESNRFKRR